MSSPKRRILWIGDAGCSTGFAKVTHEILDRIHTRWNVGVLGINYRGDPHDHEYRIWPAGRDGDQMGFMRAVDLVKRGKPDVVFIHQDPWWICGYLEYFAENIDPECMPKLIGYMPVDTKGEIRPAQGEALSKLDFALFYTKFAEAEGRSSGIKTRTGAVYLGVDTEFFHPVERNRARGRIGFHVIGDGFLVGNVNRNQSRKRIDLTVRAFAEWLAKYPHDDVYLYLHMDRMERGGWNLNTLATYYGLTKPFDRVFYPDTMDGWDGTDSELMSSVYSSFDVQITTPLGEGWGLTQLEGLACGVPQIAPDWSALGEWLTHGAILIPCRDTQVLTGTESNGVGGVVDTAAMVEAMESLYRDRRFRQRLANEGRTYAESALFSWERAAMYVETTIDYVVNTPRESVAA